MLVKAFLSLCNLICNVILGIFDILPDFPEAARLAISDFFDLIFSNCSLISFFLPVDFAVSVLLCSVAVMNFDKIYKVLMWVLRKIPALGIE